MGDDNASSALAARRERAGGPILILVHGTGDTQADAASEPEAGGVDDEARWWTRGSPFDGWLKAKVVPANCEAWSDDEPVQRFVWSGANSEAAREAAAKELAAILEQLRDDGRRVHLLSHSHGGNVVRRALEIVSRGSGRLPDLGVVLSFGTPFFHYSQVARATGGAIGCALVAAVFLAGLRVWRWNGLSLIEILTLAGLGGAGLMILFPALEALFKLNFQSRRDTERLAKRIAWKNFYSPRDEAISLLMSFNKPLKLARLVSPGNAMPAAYVMGLIAFSGAAALIFAVTAVLLAETKALEGGGSIPIVGMIFIFLLVLKSTFWIAYGALFVVTYMVLALVFWGADWLVTSRLRGVAYGDDAQHGMVAVERFPWRGAEAAAIEIEGDLDLTIEQHIAARSAPLWRSIRRELRQNEVLLGQDLASAVARSLTWNELAHTVYARVEPFAELVAQHLCETGDWIRPPGGAKPRLGLVSTESHEIEQPSPS